MDIAGERRMRADLHQLVQHVRAGDVQALRTLLEARASPELFTALREHKLLLNAPAPLRPNTASAMVAAAGQVLDAVERDRLARQLQLMTLVADRADRLQAHAEAISANLPVMSLADLLQVAQKAFNRLARQFIDGSKEWYDPNRPVGLVEREWHDLNGKIADVTAAVCRAVNLASARIQPRRRLRDGRRGDAEKMLVRLASLCSVLNGLDWVRDSTAFRDLDVTSIELDEVPVVTLEFRDPRRSLLRTLGVRREVVMESFARRPDRIVGRWLDANASAAIQNAVERYLRTVRASAAGKVDPETAARSAEMHLNALDFEDDMLFGWEEQNRRIAGRYLLSSMLQWSEIAARTVGESLPKSAARQFLPAPIAFADVLDDVSDPTWVEVLHEAWIETTVALPVTNHWDLVRKPFVRDADGVVRPLLHGATGQWNAAIRERLLRGGPLAKEVGAKWEKYFADRFRENGWKVIGEGIRLRAGGSVITDMDLLVVRGDLLLIVQVKALGGSAMNPYDHWRYRKVIEKGCWQAGVAYEHLKSNQAYLQSVVGRASAGRIRVIQPIVLTNLGLFEGWEHVGVPVLGETMLKSITVGSKVDYVDPKKGGVVHTHHLLRPEELTTETIVKALRSPIELVIAPETGAVAHFRERVAGIDFLVPQFTAPELPKAPPAPTTT